MALVEHDASIPTTSRSNKIVRGSTNLEVYVDGWIDGWMDALYRLDQRFCSSAALAPILKRTSERRKRARDQSREHDYYGDPCLIWEMSPV